MASLSSGDTVSTFMMTTDEAAAAMIEPDDSDEGGLEDILQVFKIFKLARVLKLARHSPGLQAIAYTLKNSMKELGLLVFLITISGLIFASFTYFIELGGGESGLTSIPTGIYWVVVTMTTVGYGDIAPVYELIQTSLSLLKIFQVWIGKIVWQHVCCGWSAGLVSANTNYCSKL